MNENRKELNSEEFIYEKRDYNEGSRMVRNVIKREKKKRFVKKLIYCLILFMAIFMTIGYETNKYHEIKNPFYETKAKIIIDNNAYLKIFSYNSLISTKYYAKLYYSGNKEYEVEIVYNNYIYSVSNEKVLLRINDKDQALEFDIIYQGEVKHYIID